MCLKIMILNLKKMTRIKTSKKQIGPTLLSAGLEHFRKIIKYILTINSSLLQTRDPSLLDSLTRST